MARATPVRFFIQRALAPLKLWGIVALSPTSSTAKLVPPLKPLDGNSKPIAGAALGAENPAAALTSTLQSRSAAMGANSMGELSKLDHALDNARHGFSVFPLRANDKRPIVENWQNVATCDESRIRQWWAQYPEANIGGTTANLLVVDVDPAKGGAASFSALALVEDFPKTTRHDTQSGGSHIVYALPPHTFVRNSAGKLGQGLDTRSFGGYIVLPGSTIDGRAYTRANQRRPTEAPKWLIDRCKAAKPKGEAAGKRIVEEDDAAVDMAFQWLARYAPEASVGTRGYTAYKVAARLYDYGVTQDTCRELLTEWSEAKCNPPMDTADIDHAADSAIRNRENAIGASNPNAPGFEAMEIAARVEPVVDIPATLLESIDQGAAKALTHSGDPLVEGVIDRGTFSTWYGPPKSGKTFVVLDLCGAVGTGGEWAGKKVHKGAVVYVAAEGGRGIYKRLRALQQRRPETVGAPLYIVRLAVDLLHGRKHVELLTGLCQEAASRAGLPVELVVIDTIARALGGGDENSPADMGALVKNLDDLRERTGAHVLGIHHTGKDTTKGMRGHSSLLGAVDTEIQILNRVITSPNQRDLEDDLELRFDLKTVNIGLDGGGNHVSSCVVELRANWTAEEERVPLSGSEAALFKAIDKSLGIDLSTVFSWQKAAEIRVPIAPPNSCDRESVSSLLREMVEKGWLRKVGRNQWVRRIGENGENGENRHVKMGGDCCVSIDATNSPLTE